MIVGLVKLVLSVKSKFTSLSLSPFPGPLMSLIESY